MRRYSRSAAAIALLLATLSLLACDRRRADPLEQARRLADEGKHEEAVASYDAILRSAPDDARAVSGWCRSVRRLGRVESIRVGYADAPGPGAKLARGLAAVYAGNADSAESELTQALAAFESMGDRMAQATTLSALGIVDLSLRDRPKEALARLERAEALARAAGDEIATAEILNNRSNVLLRDGDTAGAERALIEADRLAAHLRLDGLRATVATGLGNLRLDKEDWNGAIEAFGRARKVLEARSDPLGLGSACINMALAFQRTARHREAIEAATAAGAAGRAAKDPRLEARALEVQGNSLVDLGEIEKARATFQSALELLKDVDAPESLRAVWTGLGNVTLATRDLDAACSWYGKSLEADLAAEDAEGEAIDRLNLGNAYMEAGRWAAAAAEFDRAEELYRDTVDDPGRHARALVGLARIDEAVGNPAHGRDRLLRALDLTRTALDRSNEALVLTLLGHRELTDGQAQSALGRFEEAGRLLSDAGERPGMVRELVSASDALRALGRLDEARERAKEALRIIGTDADPDLRGLVELALGRTAAARSDDRPALDHLHRADQFLAEARDDEARIDVQVLASRIHEHGGDREAALATLDAAVKLDQAILDRAGGSDFATGLQELTPSAPRALAVLRARMGDATGSLEALECGRARALRRRILAAGMSEADEAQGREWRRVRGEISRITALLRGPSLSKAERADLLEKLDRAERDSARVLRAQEQALGQRTLRSDVRVETLRQRLSENEALAVYALDDPASYLWLVRRDGVEVLQIASAKQLRESAAALYAPLLAGDAPSTMAAAAQLGAAVVGPLAARWTGIDRLYVVPDDALWSVPFQALRTGEGSNAKFVAEILQTVVLPAAALLPAADAAPDRQPDARKDLVAFGDPLFERASSGSKWQLVEEPAPVLRGLAESARGLERLPASGTEARTIAAAYRPGRSVVLVGEEATEESFKSWAGRHPAVLHVATHALSDEHVLDRSALVLAADRAGNDDGLLTVGEIAGLRLDGSLVVLSACRTAGHRIVGAEGMQGLARAFLGAGAGAVVATQWPVEDRAAAEMMIAFHRGLAAGRPAARALNDAQKDLMRRRDSELASPATWAAFILVGNGRLGISKR